MLIILVCGAAGGVVAGFCRARIFGLAPVILLVGVVAIAYAGASGRALPIIGLGFLAAITALASQLRDHRIFVHANGHQRATVVPRRAASNWQRVEDSICSTAEVAPRDDYAS